MGIRRKNLCRPSGRCEQHALYLVVGESRYHGRDGSGLAGAGIAVDDHYVAVVAGYEVGDIMHQTLLTRSWRISESRDKIGI